MRDYQEFTKEALVILHERRWGSSVPEVRAKLRLAINSLYAQKNQIFQMEPEEIASVIKEKKNAGIRRILRQTTPTEFAFAIYIAEAA